MDLIEVVYIFQPLKNPTPSGVCAAPWRAQTRQTRAEDRSWTQKQPDAQDHSLLQEVC